VFERKREIDSEEKSAFLKEQERNREKGTERVSESEKESQRLGESAKVHDSKIE